MTLRIVLALLGLAFVVIGLNTALGGMTTLGWQFPSDVLTVTSPEDHARHDSNARFFAGIFAAIGLIFVLGARDLQRFGDTLILLLLAIAVGGLFRLFQTGYSPLTDMALLPSLIAELIFGPVLALWIHRSRM